MRRWPWPKLWQIMMPTSKPKSRPLSSRWRPHFSVVLLHSCSKPRGHTLARHHTCCLQAAGSHNACSTSVKFVANCSMHQCCGYLVSCSNPYRQCMHASSSLTHCISSFLAQILSCASLQGESAQSFKQDCFAHVPQHGFCISRARSCATLQALDDDEMMRRYAALLARQDTARENELKAMQARTAMRAEVAGLEVTH